MVPVSPNRVHALSVLAGIDTQLIQDIYDTSFFYSSDRVSYYSNGNSARWGLDCRIPLLSGGDLLSNISNDIAGQVRLLGGQQVVGIGCAGTLLVGSILALNHDLQGGIVRSQRKKHGFKRIVEGDLRRECRTILVDDILSSGNTLVNAADELRAIGLDVCAAVPIFDFAWRTGAKRLTKAGLLCSPLCSLSYSSSRDNSYIKWETVNTKQVIWESRHE